MDRNGNTLLQVGDWVLLGSVVIFLLFVALYWYTSPKWFKNAAAWNVMGAAITIISLLMLIFGAVWFPDWYHVYGGYARIGAFALAGVVGLQRIVWLWKVQVKKGLEDEELAERLKGTP